MNKEERNRILNDKLAPMVNQSFIKAMRKGVLPSRESFVVDAIDDFIGIIDYITGHERVSKLYIKSVKFDTDEMALGGGDVHIPLELSFSGVYTTDAKTIGELQEELKSLVENIPPHLPYPIFGTCCFMALYLNASSHFDAESPPPPSMVLPKRFSPDNTLDISYDLWDPFALHKLHKTIETSYVVKRRHKEIGEVIP